MTTRSGAGGSGSSAVTAQVDLDTARAQATSANLAKEEAEKALATANEEILALKKALEDANKQPVPAASDAAGRDSVAPPSCGQPDVTLTTLLERVAALERQQPAVTPMDPVAALIHGMDDEEQGGEGTGDGEPGSSEQQQRKSGSTTELLPTDTTPLPPPAAANNIVAATNNVPLAVRQAIEGEVAGLRKDVSSCLASLTRLVSGVIPGTLNAAQAELARGVAEIAAPPQAGTAITATEPSETAEQHALKRKERSSGPATPPAAKKPAAPAPITPPVIWHDIFINMHKDQGDRVMAWCTEQGENKSDSIELAKFLSRVARRANYAIDKKPGDIRPVMAEPLICFMKETDQRKLPGNPEWNALGLRSALKSVQGFEDAQVDRYTEANNTLFKHFIPVWCVLDERHRMHMMLAGMRNAPGETGELPTTGLKHLRTREVYTIADTPHHQTETPQKSRSPYALNYDVGRKYDNFQKTLANGEYAIKGKDFVRLAFTQDRLRKYFADIEQAAKLAFRGYEYDKDEYFVDFVSSGTLSNELREILRVHEAASAKVTDWDKFKDWLRKACDNAPVDKKTLAQEKLVNHDYYQRKNGWNIARYVGKLKTDLLNAEVTDESMKVRYFLAGLDPVYKEDMRRDPRTLGEWKTMQDAADHVHKIENDRRTASNDRGNEPATKGIPRTSPQHQHMLPMHVQEGPAHYRGRSQHRQEPQEGRNRSQGSGQGSSRGFRGPSPGRGGFSGGGGRPGSGTGAGLRNRVSDEVSCGYCKRRGHRTEECWTRKSDENRKSFGRGGLVSRENAGDRHRSRSREPGVGSRVPGGDVRDDAR